MLEPLIISTTPPTVRSTQYSKDQLAEVKTLLTRAMDLLGGLIEERGCLHEDRIDVTTLGSSMRKFFCHDCDKRFEEEWCDVGI